MAHHKKEHEKHVGKKGKKGGHKLHLIGSKVMGAGKELKHGGKK